MVRREDGRPLHEQIAADLRAKIMSGDLKPGDPLPSTSRLVEQYSAANPTIQAAVRLLKAEGFLFSRPGKAVYVRDRQPFVVEVSPYFTPSPGGYSYELLEVREVQPPGEVAEGLGLPEGGTAIMRRRLMRYNGEPVELDWSYYPADLATGTPLAQRRKIRGGAPRVLEELGFPQREMVDTVSVRPPTREEIEALDLPEVPVIRQFRVIYSDDRRPVEAAVFVKGSHLYQLRYRLPV